MTRRGMGPSARMRYDARLLSQRIASARGKMLSLFGHDIVIYIAASRQAIWQQGQCGQTPGRSLGDLPGVFGVISPRHQHRNEGLGTTLLAVRRGHSLAHVTVFLFADDVAGHVTDFLNGDQRMRPLHDGRGPHDAANHTR